MIHETSKLARMAGDVATEHKALGEAIQAEQAEKVTMLNTLLKFVGPALPAISSRIIAAREGKKDWIPSAHLATNRGDFEFFFDGDFARGVLVSDGEGPDIRGTNIVGTALYLLENGKFVELLFSGEIHQNRWAWRAEPRILTPVALVQAKWEVSAIFEYVHDALQSQLTGKKAERIKKLGENVDKLHAVSVLLRGIEKSWR